MMILSYFIGKRYYPIPYNMLKLYFILLFQYRIFSFILWFRDNLQIGILCVLIMNLIIFTLEKKRIYGLFRLLR
ncbi:MAG: hypothetical protein CM15mP121_0460 [Bacteroidota bacterium]|nr:MAG: hypothetical protein CM15mP121_0460 [Bacteroidota bacterium]